MRYLFFLIALLIPFTPVFAITGQEATYEWSQGKPTIAGDATGGCTSKPTTIYDWSGGKPVIVANSSVTCTAGGAPPVVEEPVYQEAIIWFD